MRPPLEERSRARAVSREVGGRGDAAGGASPVGVLPHAGRAEALATRADEFTKLKKWDEALAAYRAAVEKDPEMSAAWYMIGAAEVAKNSAVPCEAAHDPFKRCVELDPNMNKFANLWPDELSGAEPLRDGEELFPGLAPPPGNQAADVAFVVRRGRLAIPARRAEVAEEVMRHEDHQDALLVAGPAEHDILAEAPLAAQRALEALQVSSLCETDGFHGNGTPGRAPLRPAPRAMLPRPAAARRSPPLRPQRPARLRAALFAGLSIALIDALLVAGCADYAVTFNDRTLYMPPALFRDFSLDDEALRECVTQHIVDGEIASAGALTLLDCSQAGRCEGKEGRGVKGREAAPAAR